MLLLQKNNILATSKSGRAGAVVYTMPMGQYPRPVVWPVGP